MAIERVRAYLKKWDLDGRILEFPVSSATVELAAQAAGVIPARIAKTLSLMLPDGPVLLIDDIYTTGATIDALCGVLQEAGLHKLYFLTLCSAVRG